MKSRTRLQNSNLIALTCLALTVFACTKSDSLGSVGGRDGGADGTGSGGSPAPDVSPVPDLPPAPDVTPDSGCQYPAESHVNATGDTVWSWRFHWQDVNLAATCAAWGADAKVILEVDIPANPSGSGTTLPTCPLDTLSTGAGPRCAMANAWRFEAVCTDSQLIVELPSINTFHGYYHVESTTYPNSARHLVSQDIHCSRDLYLFMGIGSPPSTVPPKTDAGDPCAACTAGQVCVQSFDGTCHTTGPGCITVTDTCRTKLSASGAKSCTSLPECQSDFCSSPYQCRISPPCGTEAPQAAIYCYGP